MSRFFLAHTGTFAQIPSIQATLTIVSYPRWAVPLGMLSMALFRPFLAFNRQLRFAKMLGTGADGHFSGRANLKRWAIFAISEQPSSTSTDDIGRFHARLFGRFITGWWSVCQAKPTTCILEPYMAHGTWSGVDAREWISAPRTTSGQMAVLTRATVRWNRMSVFHRTARSIGRSPLDAPGCSYALGIGEWPLRLQATFSIWSDESTMKNFAYGDALHQDTIRRTRKEGWYKEELFLRAHIVAFVGSDHPWACGANP